MSKKSKKILVTGGAGFIGSNFILYMLKKYPSYQIVNLDKLTYAGNIANLALLKNEPRYKFIKGDICAYKTVKEAICGCNWVVNFAAESHVDRSINGPAIFIKTNIVGTQILLDVAKKENIERFHHISTDEVFGALPLNCKVKFCENTCYNPRSPYSASKASSDHLVRAYFETYQLSVSISNCSNNYGPYQFPEKIIPLFITNALQNIPLPIYGRGRAVRDYLYVADHCRAIDLILHRGEVGETYCIGGDAEKNGIEIANTILGQLKKPLSLKTFVADRPGHDMHYAINHNKITTELKWQPKVSFGDGISRTIEWYRKNQHWWRKLVKNNFN
ncbi:MAG: dTDP-glucose 4,6-dehydratase [Candidatus Berkelbacteria bacterium Licking1014_7]|uniref:dTDP-glucose 4,6-dehydratase n=1 Tax=Candidatus Berkelbacteria bacterium Licking1014_7 TaxID=2017147 RepID=A0A554LJ19_9BACT|nr:MAG: dTDP-glucose 4,6-dehydratase [Candidatus Berkelbacteria bacterium Licking1014_7]